MKLPFLVPYFIIYMRLFQHKEAYRALGFPEFRAYVIGNTFFTIALLIQEVLIAYEIYKITHNPLALGLIGLAEAVPFISLVLFGGHFADNHNKKRIMQVLLFSEPGRRRDSVLRCINSYLGKMYIGK